ncbi:MAG: Transcriptional regulator, TrmB [uncultured bacterium (gcode 4)]|uniref:Transcriptional regulator, TrmB n=1 Tax=uncultured bacterium (gcode 4) TaxID=1234023 RepID=K1XGJ5_9BACT|nr:MAG: Transcriptional regulator, TrmB [uncultured bacterium (gcode 4)]
MIQFLESIGFTQNEARTYLAGLSLGYSAVSTIAKKAWINRTTAYAVLDDLVAKWFVYESYRGNARYYSVLDPENLLEVFRKRISKIEKILPELQAMNANIVTGPKVKYYQWFEEVKQLYIQEYKDSPIEMRIFKAWVERLDEKKKLRDFRKELIKKIHSNQVRIIGNTTSSTKEDDKKGNIERRNIQDSELFLPASIKIYGNKVHFVSLKNNLFGVEIENEDIASCLKQIFDCIWKNNNSLSI